MVKRRVTLSDVAEATGLSAITISRAFTNPEKVKPDTLSVIQKAGQELGYTPNRAARALKSKQTKTIGIVNPNMSNPFFGNITREMVMKCQKQGYDALIFDSYELEEYEEKAIQNLIDYSVDGVIISTISTNLGYKPKYISELNAHGIPFVLLDRELEGEYNGIYIDNMDSGYQMGRHVALKHDKDTRIEIIGASDISMVSNNRIAGFRAALYEHDISIHHADFNMDLAYQKARHILESNPESKVFIGLNNQITLGIIKAVIEKGLQPQVDINVYSIDDIPYSDVFALSIPCITHNLNEMAFQAVNSIIRLINGEKLHDNKVVIRGHLKT
ncbi:LacI family DNA-binding transcriptional regulator [Vibrio scophthalmi]|uniref:Autoinducer 2-binding periplasmic protein LuxP n=1 Tax=Vibrio scophthalmi TaxID=45658 RepID=A0A1E3WNM5_9VIBR|nr:LacI family DNA-binding transcriptional regulator [Vibrio scophthalmi]ODS10582.1 Lactose operon repressor [Vibrio scophthalmi]